MSYLPFPVPEPNRDAFPQPDPHALYEMIHYRCVALEQYSLDLIRSNSSASSSFFRGLDLIRDYARATRSDADGTYHGESQSELQKQARLIDLLDRLRGRERLVDHGFARSGQIAVPLSLRRRVDEELREVVRLADLASRPIGENALDLGVALSDACTDSEEHESRHSAILAIGPPNRFDFWTYDLVEEFPGTVSPTDAGLALLTVPYLEGTKTLWQPVVLGHELGHLRLRAMINTGHLHAVSAELFRSDLLAPALGVAVERQRTLYISAWLTELLCDLNAIRSYGPAALAAIAEMLYVIGPAEKSGAWKGSPSHPPLGLRIAAMLRLLRYRYGSNSELWDSLIEPITQSFAALGSSTSGASEADIGQAIKRILDPRTQLHSDVSLVTVEAFMQVLDGLIEHAADAPYLAPWWDATERRAQVEHVRDCLVSRRVPADPKPVGMSPLCHADVVNGAWLAYMTDRIFVSGGRAEGSAVPFDKLATLTCEAIEFVALWDRAVQEAKVDDPVVVGEQSIVEAPTTRAGGAVLSGLAIRDALARGSSGLYITPLVGNQLQESAVDLRLGTRFIVSRRTGTADIDPLGDPDRWRGMEDHIQEPWGGRFVLHPGELVLASTLEFIVLPDDLCGQVLTRSSYGRLGLITATAVQVNPGTRGLITLELVNHGQAPISLIPGHRIAQLVLLSVDHPIDQGVLAFSSKYQFADGPESSKIHTDRELATLLYMRDRSPY
jgi:deoxycytidine triphosphate deaminase